jgi:hypothetical protein
VVGWNNPVTPDKGVGSALFAFDLLLGANAYPYNVDGVPPVFRFPLKPATRPFPWSTVKAALEAKGLAHSLEVDVIPHIPATLSADGAGMVLAPSIKYIEVDTGKPNSIHIQGDFGDDPGTSHRDVYVSQERPSPPQSAGQPPNVSSFGAKVDPACTWKFDTVTCQLKDDQAGWVRVVARGHPSNPVPLTMWKPTLYWANSDHQVAVLKPIFRADIHRYRENAIDPPKSHDPFNIAPSPGSTCHINGLWQVIKAGKGVAELDAAYDNASKQNVVFMPAVVPDGFPIVPITNPQTCNAGGAFDPTGGAWKFDFGVLFRAPSTSDADPNRRPSGGPTNNGPSSGRDDGRLLLHDTLMVDLMQYAQDRFRAHGPPLLTLDPASPDDREAARTANFKAGTWRSQLQDPPGTTLTVNGLDGLYAPDDKSAR